MDEQAELGEPLKGRRVLVTGASGVVGRALLPDLLRSGAQVLAVSRRAPDWYELLPKPHNNSPLFVDLRFDVPSAGQLAGVTDCVHLAATLFPVSAVDFFHDNLQVSKNVASALARYAARLRSVIHVSSLAARGPGMPADYSHPYLDARAVSAYGQSKLASELIIRSLLPGPVPLAVLRPGVVLSTADDRLVSTVRSLRRAPAFVLRRLPEAVSAVAVEDLSRAIVAALLQEPGLQGVFEICHPHPMCGWELAGQTAAASDRRAPPRWLLATIASSSMLAARLLGRAPMLTMDKLVELSQSQWRGDAAAFATATGWAPRVHPAAFIESVTGAGAAA